MPNLQRIINLIKKTGDKAIILDENGDPNYVIMGISDYERLVVGKAEVKGLTEEEFLDKINRDIAIWKENQEINHLPIEQHDFSREFGGFSTFGLKYFEPEQKEAEPEEDRYYFEPVE